MHDVSAEQPLPVTEHDVTSADGTRIRVWRAGTAGPDVLLCPGLGTVPEAWPALLGADCGLRVRSWYHRGMLGSARPADPARIGLADHVDDAVATLDDAGIGRCVVVGWSMGVTVAVGLADRHPERVSGLLLIAGAPGRSFEAVLGVLDVPVVLRESLARAAAHGLSLAAPVYGAVLRRLPVNSATTWALRHTGFMLPAVRSPDAVAAVRRFLHHDWRWYFTTALALGDAPRLDLTGLTCPVTVLAGRYDVLSGPASMFGPAGPLPQARLRLLPNTHFLPLEAVDEVREELHLLLGRAEAVDQAVHATLTRGSRPRP